MGGWFKLIPYIAQKFGAGKLGRMASDLSVFPYKPLSLDASPPRSIHQSFPRQNFAL